MKKCKIIIIILISITALNACGTTKKQKELKVDYYNQNIVFIDILDAPLEENRDKYMTVNIKNPNPDGISFYTYKDLALYERKTGNILTFSHVIDYLSQEFEDDGEIRIFTNGRHTEIAQYIEWAMENREESYVYSSKLSNIHDKYYFDNEEFKSCAIFLLPTEMIDELIKKEADPNYELDLISIQQRWLDEGRAKILDNGYQIEYFPTN